MKNLEKRKKIFRGTLVLKKRKNTRKVYLNYTSTILILYLIFRKNGKHATKRLIENGRNLKVGS